MSSALTVENQKQLLKLKREQLRRKFPKFYIAKYHHRTTHQGPMSFGARYRFLEEVYKDLDSCDDFCSMKAVQSGLTDVLTVGALEEAAKGLRILYVFPDLELRGIFVKDRLDIQLKTIPYYVNKYASSLGSSANVGLKHYGMGTLNFVSSRSPAQFTMYQADELDKCDQKNIAMAGDRMDASVYKYYRRIGNPSIEGYGISKQYNESSQGVWVEKCPRCGKQQVPDFFKNVVTQIGELHYDVIKGAREAPEFVCVKCGKSFDPMTEGRWVHKFPDIKKRGYHINQLFSANVPLASLVDLFFKSIGNEIETQIFWNSKLGLPFSAQGSKITLDILDQTAKRISYTLTMNDTTQLRLATRVYVGIDVGKYFHVVARELLPNGMRKLVFFGKYSSVQEMVTALKDIKSIKVIVIDENPEAKLVEDMKKTMKRMFSCNFLKGATILDLRKGGEEFKKERRVKIDRTFILDSVKADFFGQKMCNPVNARDLNRDIKEEYGEYYQQLLASTRIYDETSQRFIWRETSPDHSFLAEGYCKFAELVDNRLLDYYKDMVKEIDPVTKAVVDAPIIPKTEDGQVDISKLKVQSAESFLRNLFNSQMRKGGK